MSFRRVLAASIVLAPALASAQAPGDDTDYGGDYYRGPSATAPQQYVAPQPAPPPEFNARWSIALAMGGVSLAPQDQPDAKADFRVGEIAVRYRGWRHLELELAMAGGTQQLPEERGGGEGDYEIAQITLAAKYRFNVQDHWNWWLMAGFGSTTVSPKGASDEQRSNDERPHGLVGIGLEYRFQKFALQAEAKAIKVGPTDEEQMRADVNGENLPDIGGGMFTLGGAFYF